MKGLIAKSQLFIKRHGSTILTVVGGVGTIVTAVTAVKATPKALKQLEKAKEEKGDELTRYEMVKTAAPTYVPTIIMGVGTLVCIFGASTLSKRQQAALVSAFTLVDGSFKEYKKKLKELYGEEAHEKIVDAIAIEKAEDMYVRNAYMCGTCDLTSDESCSDTVVFYDEHSGRFFESTIEQVINAEYHLNRNYILRGYSYLNEFYEFLGIEETEYGSVLGWTPTDEGEYWIEFNHVKSIGKDGMEFYRIEMPFEPSYDFLENSYY